MGSPTHEKGSTEDCHSQSNLTWDTEWKTGDIKQTQDRGITYRCTKLCDDEMKGEDVMAIGQGASDT